MNPRYLILGASGLIGRRLFEHLGQAAIGTYCRTQVPNGLYFDATEDSLSEKLQQFKGIKFGVIAFAEARIDQCARARDTSAVLNITATKKAIDALLENEIKPVFMSSDMVFDGSSGNYSEADPAKPCVTYGEMKIEIENYLASSGCPYLSLRLARVICSDPNFQSDLLNWATAIDRDSTIVCASDQLSSVIDVDDVATGLRALAEKGKSGLFHLSGPSALSRADLFNLLVSALGEYRTINPKLEVCSIHDFTEFAERRPLDISLNSEKFINATGFRPRPIEETCREFAKLYYSK